MTAFHLPTDGSVLIVDDQNDEALPLMHLLSEKSIPFTYYTGNDPDQLPSQPSQKVRLAFFDIQLIPQKNALFYARKIGDLLETLICENNGPFVLVLWSGRLDAYGKEVKQYLLSGKNKRRPLDIIKLDKTDFFENNEDLESYNESLAGIRRDLAPSTPPDEIDSIIASVGAHIKPKRVWGKKSDDALEKILDQLKKELKDKVDCFQLFTLWETKICKAAGNTVQGYSELHKDEKHWSDNIKYIIYRMARAQTGDVVKNLDNESLISNAFRTLNQTFLDDVDNNLKVSDDFFKTISIEKDKLSITIVLNKTPYKLSWNAEAGKFIFSKGDDSDPVKYTIIPSGAKGKKDLLKLHKEVRTHFEAGTTDEEGIKAIDTLLSTYEAVKPEVNTKLHLDKNVQEYLQPGNVYERPVRYAKRRKELLKNYFSQEGVHQKRSGKDIYLFNSDGDCDLTDRKVREIKFIELEVTPPCDFAEGKWLKSRVLPGVLIPENYFNTYSTLAPESFYLYTPVIIHDKKKYKIIFDYRLFKSADKKHMEELDKPIFRLRQEIHSDIISKLSSHINRLGIAQVF